MDHSDDTPAKRGRKHRPKVIDDGASSAESLRAKIKPHEQRLIDRMLKLADSDKDYVAIKAIERVWLYYYGKPRDQLDQDLQATMEKVNAILRRQQASQSSPDTIQ